MSNKFFYRESIDFLSLDSMYCNEKYWSDILLCYQLLAQWNSTKQQHSVKSLHLGQNLEEKNRKDSMATKWI